MADDPQTEGVAGGATGRAERKRAPRTAVLIVHGIGNQRPLDTLRGVVETVWTTDASVSAPKARHWLQIGRKTGDLDLPVVTTSTVSGRSHQVEFHELYWAHLMAGTRLVAVLLWLFDLVRKGPQPLRPDVARLWYLAVPFLVAAIAAAVLVVMDGGLRLVGIPGVRAPADIILPWVLTVIVVAVVMGRRGLMVLAFFAVVILLAAVPLQTGDFHAAVFWRLGHDPSLLAAGALILVMAAMGAFFLTTVVGDAARYYRNSPANVGVRREIRALGTDTLTALHNENVDRIIVVAHSLGSVIAYDVLRACWSELCRSYGNVAGVTGLAAQDRSPVRDGAPVADDVPFELDERTVWRNRSRALLSNLAAATPGTPEKPVWRVTDFVTLGSPLTHARYLNATGTNADELAANFRARVGDREAPTCPPRYDGADRRMTFTPDGADPTTTQFLHHAALFGLTRWTNLHFPSGAYNGDLVGGALAPVFGTAIKDVGVPRPGRRKSSWHGWYWRWDGATGNGPTPGHIAALRDAINLLDEPET
ncbi:MAG: hypothetical protein ACWA6X_09090 [Bauldia sp.]